MRYLFLVVALLLSAFATASNYFSWIDDHGALRNSFVKSASVSQEELDQYRELSLSDFVSEDNRIASVGYQLNPKSEKEKKKKYYTWVEADGRTRNTEYATAPQKIEQKKLVLNGGDLASDFIDADQLARQGFLREGDENPYYTWIDPTGRLTSSQYQPGSAYAPVTGSVIDYTDTNEFYFDQSSSRDAKNLGDYVPSLNAPPKSVLSLDLKLASRIRETCCAQISEDDFYSLTSDDPVYEKLTELSPSYDFPTGHSYYIPVKLPASRQTYGIKIKSFAQKGVFYPVLLFLDENREPTRYVTDSVVEYHEETWDRYAHLEGRIMIKPGYGERYVLIFTTQEDLQRVTQKKANLSILAQHEHSKLGSVEVRVIY